MYILILKKKKVMHKTAPKSLHVDNHESWLLWRDIGDEVFKYICLSVQHLNKNALKRLCTLHEDNNIQLHQNLTQNNF